GHLVPDALHHRGHLQRDCAGHNHQVALARAGAKHLRAEARDIEARRGSGDHLDRAASQAERHGPKCGFARPVEDVIDRGDQKIFLEAVINPTHAIPSFGPKYVGSSRPSGLRPSGRRYSGALALRYMEPDLADPPSSPMPVPAGCDEHHSWLNMPSLD